MANKEKNLSWDAFQSLGNPDNAPAEAEETNNTIISDARVRILLEKKQRGGKTASIILGLEDEDEDLMIGYSKDLKKKCGVGGSYKNGQIIIQGNKRELIRDYMKDKGYRDVKLAGG